MEKAGDVPLLVFIGWPWSDGTAGLLSHVTLSDGRPQFQPLELLLSRLGFKPGGVH